MQKTDMQQAQRGLIKVIHSTQFGAVWLLIYGAIEKHLLTYLHK